MIGWQNTLNRFKVFYCKLTARSGSQGTNGTDVTSSHTESDTKSPEFVPETLYELISNVEPDPSVNDDTFMWITD